MPDRDNTRGEQAHLTAMETEFNRIMDAIEHPYGTMPVAVRWHHLQKEFDFFIRLRLMPVAEPGNNSSATDSSADASSTQGSDATSDSDASSGDTMERTNNPYGVVSGGTPAMRGLPASNAIALSAPTTSAGNATGLLAR